MNFIYSFFLLGFSTFLIETFWLKQNIVVFGSTSRSAGLLLCAYFLGTALGNFYWGRKNVMFSAKRTFPLAAAAGLLSFLVYALLLHAERIVPEALYARPLTSLLVKFVFTFAAAFPLSFLLGSFFPYAARRVTAPAMAALYGMNALGSVFGILLGSFTLPPLIGYRAIFVIGMVSLLCALVLFSRAVAGTAAGRPPAETRERPAKIYLAGFFSGFLTLLLEVVFLRQISMGTDNTVYAFGSATLIMLALMFLMSLLTSRLPDKIALSPYLLPGAVLLSAAGILLSAHQFVSATDGLKTVIMDRTLGPLESFLFSAGFLPAGFLFPVSLFPLLLRRLPAAGEGGAGRFFGINGLGCALGALAGGFVFPGLLGLWGMVLFCALVYSVLPLVFFRRFLLIPVAACIALIVILNPLHHPRVTPDPIAASMPAPANLVSEKEGDYGVVSVIDFGAKRTLWLNNTYMLGGNQGIPDDRRLGLFPLMFNPDAGSAAVIGVATGMTASGLLNSGLKSITCIELVPEVEEAARRFYSMDNRGLLADPRVRVVIDDGRNFMRTTRQRFDIVLSDLFVPWHEGTSALYTLDHFRSVQDKLREGGLFLLWLPAYELTEEEFMVIAKTFCEVFPCVALWQNTFSSRGPVVGLAGTMAPLSFVNIEKAVRQRSPQPEKDFIERDPAGLLVRFICAFHKGDGLFSGIPVNTLDKPLLEFMAAAKGREFLTGENYLAFAKRMMEKELITGNGCLTGFPSEAERYRQAGFCMLNSLYRLQNGDKQEAYRYFDLYQSMTPESIHQ
jgi:spermidine synthase